MKTTVNYLKDICHKHPTAEKIIIVDSYAIGEQIINGLVKEGNEVINLKRKTVREIALEHIELHSDKHFDYLENAVGIQLMYSILKDIMKKASFSYFTDLEITPSFSRAMFETIQKLRLAGFTSTTMKKDAFITLEKGDDIHLILKKYEETLIAYRLMDNADLFQHALEISNNSSSTIFILQSNLSLSYLEETFLKSLLPEKSYKLPLTKLYGVSTPNYSPIRSISWGDESVYSYLYDLERASCNGEISLITGKTEEMEVKGIIHRIREQGKSLDECTIFYTSTLPYVTIIYQLTQKLDLPVTFGEGIPVSYTSTGRFISSLLNWMKEQYSVKGLIEFINDGSLNLGVGAPSKTVFIKILRDAQIGWNKGRYLSQLDKQILQLNDKLTGDVDNNKKEYLEKHYNNTVWMYQWFTKVFKKLPNTDGIINTKDLIDAVRFMVTNYCRMSSLQDEAAKTAIMEEVDKLKPYLNEELNPYESFEKIQDMLLTMSVNQSGPKPGHLHVSNYKKGIYNNRKNMYIVGLDNRKFPGTITEDPLLLDKERKNLGNKFPLLRESGLEKQYTMLQVIANAQGPITVSYCNFDINNNRTVSPAHLFLQCYRMKTGNINGDFKELIQSNSLERYADIMDEHDYWNCYLSSDEKQVLDDELLANYTNLLEGMRGDDKRSEEEFSVYDGLIHLNPEHFDPRSNKEKTMSAGKLELLAQCPYAFFLQEILRIRPIEDLSYDANTWLDAATRGSLLHNIFETFYKELKELNEKPSTELHEEKILTIAKNLISKQKEIVPTPNERVFNKEVIDILQCCKIFLKEEEDYCKDYDPEHFEYTFGMEGFPPAEITLPSGESFLVSGKIDRVDRSMDGHYHILDYKTGSTYNYHDTKPFKGGRQLQHFIYALAIEQHLQLSEGSVLESSYYFPTVKGLGERYTRKQDETVRANGLDILEKLIDVIKHGHFTMTDDENDCKFCNFKSVCRKESYDKGIFDKKQMTEDAIGVRKFKGVRAYD
ncbi:ATP-dependent helicase/nuclease subunit B [Evansella vedderi]|uniref:ATP-dependent helicase/nuclease subunit B n=1 Tax=Evansella vedderi TaxID=38282 RepID=A0ABT9ZTS7_9BACI|nr:PD-(D/E)XK nuclease family protein [Evansella vedderi]MDQ0254647.1 ATP-dependent helicase/nuclease subunit B [Evansella vedderi]